MPAVKRYSIRDWNKHFEMAQSRKVEGPLSWVAIPTKQDGLGYSRILSRKDGPAVYGAWVAIVQVAAKCPVRGVLADNNGPLSALDIALKTKFPEDVIATALKVVSENKIGWIVVDEWENATTPLPPQYRTEQDKTEQDTTEQDRTICAADAAASDVPGELRDWLSWWNRLNADGYVQSGVDETSPSQGVVKGWNRVQRNREVRDLLRDRDAIEREIQLSAFVRQGSWFRLEKLLGGNNRDGELILRKLLEGGYRDQPQEKTSGRIIKQGPGQNYDPSAELGSF